MKKDIPSYYSDKEYFENYLGNTSYYQSIQKSVLKCLALTDSTEVLDLGCSLGITAARVAKTSPNYNVTAIDLRSSVVEQASEDYKKLPNIHFDTADMCEYVKGDLSKFDFIYMLYSFHHILDPEDNKVRFLENIYKNMKEGAYLLITETFLPTDLSVHELWAIRGNEGYASTFWALLHSLDREEIIKAQQSALISKHEEVKAGTLVDMRANEYLITFSWLCNQVNKIGFKTIIAEPINVLNEYTLLVQK